MNPTDVVAAAIDAFNARDVDAFLSLFSPDAVMEDGDGQILAQDPATIRRWYEPLFRQNPELHADVRGRMQRGSWVVIEERVTGIAGREGPTQVDAILIFRVDHGKIITLRTLLA